MTITRCFAFTAALVLLATALPAPARASGKAEAPRPSAASPAKEARLQHARELLGKHYRRSVVRRGESWDSLAVRVRRVVERSMASQPRKVSKAVARAILAEARRYELDPLFLAAVIHTESRFRPDQRGDAGEIGIMQILPDTGEWIAEKYGIAWKGAESLLDPVVSIRLGAAYFDYLRDNFDNHGRLYLSAYNMGPTNVRRALNKRIWPKDYVQDVMKRYVALYAEMGVGGRMIASAGKPVALAKAVRARSSGAVRRE